MKPWCAWTIALACLGSAAGCAERDAASAGTRDASADGTVEAAAVAPGCLTDDAGACACLPDSRGFGRVDYRPTERVAGACSAQEATDFAAACAANPNAGTCGAWLGAHPPCARCLLGQRLEGPLRRDAFHRPEVSPGTCGQALAGETFDAGADANVGGCGATMENVGACLGWSCAGCDGGECRAIAYAGVCGVAMEPDLARCDALGGSACVLGTAEERARAIADAVCGGADAGAD